MHFNSMVCLVLKSRRRIFSPHDCSCFLIPYTRVEWVWRPLCSLKLGRNFEGQACTKHCRSLLCVKEDVVRFGRMGSRRIATWRVLARLACESSTHGGHIRVIAHEVHASSQVWSHPTREVCRAFTRFEVKYSRNCGVSRRVYCLEREMHCLEIHAKTVTADVFAHSTFSLSILTPLEHIFLFPFSPISRVPHPT